ncbi:serine protease [Sphingorhabdus sp. Alg239-R122]|uniref:S1C family serine protease n=1 Tax=Sphingorhabdus sp. Alg239-R122 TaxID=2305989 RepID=UPI0013DC8465|nr:serine protease [Sphingorhabdus sp. Alg239-R122]
MKKLLPLLMLLAGMIFLPSPAQADPEDIAAASRSVVRVVLVAREGERVFFVGHGSGVMIAPDKILTNAHVIEPVREDQSIVIGIIPSQGRKSYGGKLLSFSPANDLAVIQLQNGRLPPATIYSAKPADGASVVAIGYPASVDRAQGLQINDLITPMAPVKTPGVISGGRTSREMDTLLHTAPIASGNSGGPLVDPCGRVVGINSFGSLSDGNDAEFGFAVSAREIMQFARNANIRPRTTSAACRSAAELSREEEKRRSAELQRQAEIDRTANAEKQQARQNAERQADVEIMTSRENHMALAALLLAIATLSAGTGGILFERGKRNPAIAATGGALLLLTGAITAFVIRPGLAEREDRIAAILAENAPAQNNLALSFNGKNVCKLNTDRSRITVSELPQIELQWDDNGCINGRTQYGREGARWSRIFVPNSEQTVSINSFDPQKGEYRTERYLLGIDAMGAARGIRRRYSSKACTMDADKLTELEDMQKVLRQALPAHPNEVLVYECQSASD